MTINKSKKLVNDTTQEIADANDVQEQMDFVPKLLVNEQTIHQDDQIHVPEDILINHNITNADKGIHSGVISKIAK